MLDSGCWPDIDVVKSFIEHDLKRPFSDLKLVLVSHAHPDHSGGASRYQAAGIPVAGTTKMNDWYRGPSGYFTYLVDIMLTYLVAARTRTTDRWQRVLFPRKVAFDLELKDGETIPGFDEWIAIAAAGHTASDLSFVHKKTNTAYIADNMIKGRKGVFPPYPVFNAQSYKTTLQAYLDRGISTFLLAHYDRQEIGQAELRELIKLAPVQNRHHTNTLWKILWKLGTSAFRKPSHGA